MMKLMCILTVATMAGLAGAQSWDIVEDGAVAGQVSRSELTGRMWVDGRQVACPDLPGVIGETRQMLADAGRYQQERIGTVSNGYYASGWTWIGLAGLRSQYEPVLAVIPEPEAPEYPQPEIIVPLMDGTNVIGTARIMVDGDSLYVGAVTNSASPQLSGPVQLTAWQQELAARKAAINDVLTTDQLAAIASYFSADVDVLFASLTVNQRQFLKVQRAMVKALAKREVKELR